MEFKIKNKIKDVNLMEANRIIITLEKPLSIGRNIKKELRIIWDVEYGYITDENDSYTDEFYHDPVIYKFCNNGILIDRRNVEEGIYFYPNHIFTEIYIEPVTKSSIKYCKIRANKERLEKT